MKKLCKVLVVFCMLFSITACSSSASKTIDKEILDEIMSLYYFDTYEFKDSSYDDESEQTIANYHVTYSSTHLNYDGDVHLYCGKVYEDDEEAEDLSVEEAYSWYIDYDDDLQFDVSGTWSVETEDLKTVTSNWSLYIFVPAVSIQFKGIDNGNKTVSLKASETTYHRSGAQVSKRSAKTDDLTVDYEIDYTNSEFHFSGAMYNADPDYLRTLSYQPPFMHFEFKIDECTCQIKVNAKKIEINAMNGNSHVGTMHQD